MKSTRTLVASLVLVLAVALSACSPAAAPTPQQVEVTRVVQGTPEVLVVTATPEAKPTELPAGSIQINGAGATFPVPVYTEWIFAYSYVDPSVVINYQGIGSGGGKKAIIDGTVNFAGSDSLLKDEERASAKGPLQMFPTVAGAVVPIFNLAPEVTQTLALNGPVLADIYQGKIEKWNDPAIVALNPNENLPDQPISAVHRSDGSGTTEIFTKYLAAVSEDWKNGPGAGSSIEWPVDAKGTGIGGRGNAGVATSVTTTPYSIGYVELSYATANNIKYAELVNSAGKQLKANPETLQSAMADFGDAFDANLTIKSISNGPSADSWPIAGYTYMIVPTDMPADSTYGCLTPQKYLDFVYWALTDPAAAKRAGSLGYATLPESVRAKVFDALAKVTCDGQPIQSIISTMGK